MDEDIHYIARIEIRKAINPRPSTNNYRNTRGQTPVEANPPRRRVLQLANIAVTADDLKSLINRTTQHLALVEDSDGGIDGDISASTHASARREGD